MGALNWVRDRAKMYEEEVVDFSTGKYRVKRFHFGGRMKYGMLDRLTTEATEQTETVYETVKVDKRGGRADYYRTEYEKMGE